MNFLRRRYSTTHRHTLNYGDKVMIATGMNLGFRVILIMALVACLTTVCAVGTKEASANPGTVDLVIDADPDTSGIQDTITVENGAQFTVVIWVQPQDGQEVSVVEARVDFDASYLSVDETSYNNFQNILPHANTLFNNPLWRTMDNTNGYADYTDGTALGGTNPTTDFPMFYIKFNADDITSASGTQVTFHSEIPRKTDAFLAGLAKTGSPTGITVKVMEGPIVDFTMDPSNGNITAGNSVSFTATTTSGGPVESWAWDFNNDGTVDSTAANPTWNYGNVAGSYTVKLTGTNTLGSDSETKENAITVNPDTASKLAYNPAPATSVTAGDTWTTFKVEIRDQYDNLTTSTADVTVTPSTGAFASGTTNKAAVAGVATFSDLTYTTAGTITVTASSGSLTSAATGNIVVNPGTTFMTKLQGGLRPTEGYNIPLTMKLYDNTTILTFSNILTETPLYTFSTANENISITETNTGTKTITFQVTGLPSGIYNITLFSPHCLVNLRNGVEIAPGSVDMGTLLEGNANDDVQIAGADFSMLLNDYLETSSGDQWNSGRCDFDRNGQVTSIDFSALAANYNLTSPQTVGE